MIGLPDPEMRKLLANGTIELMPHHLYPHIARGLKITAIDKEKCTVNYNGHDLTFPTNQQMKVTMRAVNALLEEKGPK